MILELDAAQIENRCTGRPAPYNRQGHRPPKDERILGDSDFVKSILPQAKEDFVPKHQLQSARSS